jgi:hypothetical protein
VNVDEIVVKAREPGLGVGSCAKNEHAARGGS